MFSLKSKQLLVKVAKISQKKEEEFSQKEIERKIRQIRYMASQKKVTKETVAREMLNLEKYLSRVFSRERELRQKVEENYKEISSLKKQVKFLREKIASVQDPALKKKVNKLSHLIGDLMAKNSIKEEVKSSENKNKQEKTKTQLRPITLKKIDELKERILTLKRLGKFPPEKIEALEKKLTELEERLELSSVLDVGAGEETALPENKGESEEGEIRHRMLFGPRAESFKPIPEVRAGSKDMDEEMDLPPPPKKIKK